MSKAPVPPEVDAATVELAELSIADMRARLLVFSDTYNELVL
jgi:hypothetical protein